MSNLCEAFIVLIGFDTSEISLMLIMFSLLITIASTLGGGALGYKLNEEPISATIGATIGLVIGIIINFFILGLLLVVCNALPV